MKKSLMFVIATLFSIVATGCDDSKDSNELDLTSEDFWRSYEATLLFDSDSEDGVYGVIIAKGRVTEANLTIDTVSSTIEEWSYSKNENFSSAWFYIGNSMDLSKVHTYNFFSNTKSVNGSFKFPKSMSVTWPAMAYSNKDFEFSWEGDESPDLYVLGIEAEDDDYNEIEYEKQLDGSMRSAIIKSSLYQNYPNYFDVYVYPTNIVKNNNCLILTSIDSYEYEQEFLDEYGVTKNKILLPKRKTQKNEHSIIGKARVR